MNYFADIYLNILPDMPIANTEALSEQTVLSRLQELRTNRVKTIAVTPHYQPAQETISDFLAKRQQHIEQVERLAAEAGVSLRILQGAVVDFTDCISLTKSLPQLAIEQTEYLLVNLSPQIVADHAFFDTLNRIQILSRLCLIVVDIDQRFDVLSLSDCIALHHAGLLLQISASGLLDSNTRKQSLYLLANRYAQFVATGARPADAPLCLLDAMRALQRNLPAELYRRIKNNSGILLSTNASPTEFFNG